MITRRAFICCGLTLGTVSMPLAGMAQTPAKIPRLGYLSPVSPEPPGPFLEAFRQGLRDLGYVEGQNIAIEYRWAEWRPDRLPTLAAELVRLKVDVIVTLIQPAPQAAKDATTTIPIVFALVADPVGLGLVDSLARPGGNITGLSIMSTEIVGKQLELLKDAAPNVARVAILQNPDTHTHLAWSKHVEDAARPLGVQLRILEARDPDGLNTAFTAMTRERVGALLVFPDRMFFLHRTRIADLAMKHRLPTAYGLSEHVDAGGLIAYGASRRDVCRRAATYVDKILKGAKPSDLPIEQPTKFELIINMKTAKTMGLTIPPLLLLRADQIIE